ncbi:MAG: DivIVA domain-containing protein [Terracoccus sp.]
MKWFVLLVGVVVVCFVVALVLGLVGGGMGTPTSSLSHEPLPDDDLHDSDLDQLRFDVGLRGYRMTQVDGVLDRLRRALREKDEQIAVLRGDPDQPLLGGVADEPSPIDREAEGVVATTQADAGGTAPSTGDQAREGQPGDEKHHDDRLVHEQTELRQRSEPTA